MKHRVKAKLQKLMDGPTLEEMGLTKHLSDMDSQMENLIAVNIEVVDSKRKENEDAARAEAETEDLKGQMEHMQKQFGEQQENLLEATRGQEEAKDLKQQLERMREEFEEREKILLETARAQAEAEDLKKRLECMEREREARAARPDLLDIVAPFIPLLGLFKK